ncbi:MAG TPA: LysR family transcriptional regulator [Devosiaceae bacterium]|nr:LysR family transcriptional regulator [Devosiaceae bacterium]
MHAAVLKYFVAVARAGSIRQASEDLHVAASAVSRQIQKLELEIGEPVFQRLPNGLRLTHVGRLVLAHAEATLKEFARLQGEVDALQGRRTGVIRIAALDSLVVRFLPDLLSRFHARNPEVEFEVRTEGHLRVSNAVAMGDADIGITFGLPHAEDLSFCAGVPMPIMAMVAADHRLAAQRDVTLTECAQYNLMLQFDTEPVRSVISVELSVFERIGRVLLRTNNLMMVAPLIRSGVGIAFFTALGFQEDLRAGAIRALHIKGSRLDSLQLGLLVSKRWPLTPAATALTSYLGHALEILSKDLNQLTS